MLQITSSRAKQRKQKNKKSTLKTKDVRFLCSLGNLSFTLSFPSAFLLFVHFFSSFIFFTSIFFSYRLPNHQLFSFPLPHPQSRLFLSFSLATIRLFRFLLLSYIYYRFFLVLPRHVILRLSFPVVTVSCGIFSSIFIYLSFDLLCPLLSSFLPRGAGRRRTNEAFLQHHQLSRSGGLRLFITGSVQLSGKEFE